MAESMVSIVVGLMVIAIAVMVLGSHRRREHRTGALHHDGHRLWDRMRHRH
ncbi:hypothetical protein [Paraburkholderia megapolitana]|uniref:Uncharacterized protein n=1 Tax=Paraburkholderia megapolitana TaxID=420953 RepID=A0A1I3TRX3_9BURK|nr:hypothetical protein [Paraburkholderia megapolitana]SFJ74018.1 hypothetical protein SAMN05192543_110117 [Paraburkholderia megapolitana]